MANNPFTIDVDQGAYGRIGRGLGGLGAILGEKREMKNKQSAERAINEQAQAIFDSGKPSDIAKFMISNPEAAKRVQGAMTFVNEQTQKNFVDGSKRIAAGENPEAVLIDRIKLVQQQGGNVSESNEALQEYYDDPQGFMQNNEKVFAIYDPSGYEAFKKATNTAQGSMGTDESQFNRLIAGLSLKEQELAKRIKIGLNPRATGSASQTIAASDTSEDVAASEAIIEGAKSGAKEAAKLAVQYKLAPGVKLAVADAVALSTAKANINKENRSNAKAIDVYDTGISALSSAMDEAYTGPIAGLMPALTAKAQIADGAVSVMGPVLKQMFRSAGEGVFTDKDQELLMGMIPTRKDLPEARAAKLKNIDAIVRAKLAPEDLPEAAPLPSGVTEEDIAFTMQANNLTRAQVIEKLGGM
jgi:hypothetical protein